MRTKSGAKKWRTARRCMLVFACWQIPLIATCDTALISNRAHFVLPSRQPRFRFTPRHRDFATSTWYCIQRAQKMHPNAQSPPSRAGRCASHTVAVASPRHSCRCAP